MNYTPSSSSPDVPSTPQSSEGITSPETQKFTKSHPPRKPYQPPIPRLAKTTTVTSSVALVLSISVDCVILWIVQTCKVYSTLSDTANMQFNSYEFGKVGVQTSLFHLISKRGRDIGVWVQWLNELEAIQTPHRCEWEVVEVDNGWSPGLTADTDHLAKIPDEYIVNQAIGLKPFVGQWINFDTSREHLTKLSNPKGLNRFFITEYMPISSPIGFSICQIGRALRIILTATIVKGTDHKSIYEIPDFGFVLDKKSVLRSGATQQIVIERTTYNTRKLFGISWKVMAATILRSTDEMIPTQRISMRKVAPFGSYELCSVISGERQNASHRQPLGSNTSMNSANGRRENYNSFEMNKKRQRPTQEGLTLDLNAMIEKIDFGRKCGILWVFDTNSNVHFVFQDDPPFELGLTVDVHLISIADETAKNGFRWSLSRYKKLPPRCMCMVEKNRLMVLEEAMYTGNNDKLGRSILRGKLFSTIIDEHNLFNQNRIPPFVDIVIIITRVKVANALYDPTKTVNAGLPEMFSWVLVQLNKYIPQPPPQVLVPSTIISHYIPGHYIQTAVQSSENSKPMEEVPTSPSTAVSSLSTESQE
ncbi:unnamed protein product [Caenorhabditis bovis]|uniref:Uncharacterized protein n=1 Tax=Caenorhabditis bovis TaxID=2654633 RepID=A0A8S1EWZ8_9PELO|nr:unnamed protein product [Caenorhabditis bovis]